jgi:hypothetical protein
MRKLVKPIVSAILVTAVVASSLFCCCVGKLAHAASLKNTTAQACCHGDKASDHKDTKPCNCGAMNSAPADVVQLSAIIAPVHVDSFYSHVAVIAFQQTVRIASLRTDYGGASPGQSSSVPLFLQYRSIRI